MSRDAEVRVFDCDDLWRHIKTFLFSPRKCWAGYAPRLGPCQGGLFIAYVLKHEYVCPDSNSPNGRFTTAWYTCNRHAIGERSHLIR